MTRAPQNLLAVRSLLLAHLNVDPDVVRGDDLEPAEVGIVGDTSHRGGYHCGSDRVVANDYSVVESPRDSSGLTLDAAALDVGYFKVRSGGGTHTLYSFSIWCAQQCGANAPDTRDIREIIYSPDGRVVRRWDRLGRRTSGNNSHLWHTHFSFFRDSIKAGRNQTPLYRRYLTHIGLLEDDMTPAQFVTLLRDPTVAQLMRALPWQYVGGGIPKGMSTLGVVNETLAGIRALGEIVARESSNPEEIQALLAQLPTPVLDVDELVIIEGVLAGLTPEKIAAAIPPTMARQIVDELTRRLAA